MPKARNTKADAALTLFKKGFKLVDIAKRLDVPEGTVRRWKSTYGWGKEGSEKSERSEKTKSERSDRPKKNGAPYGNQNAVGSRGGHGAPPGNQRARKHGLFSRYMPQETMEIIDALGDSSPLDLLWDQIQIAYAAILRAQQINYVVDRDDMTTTKIKEGYSDTGSTEEWEVQQAWDKQANFMKAQARAQAELRSMIKQYDEMLHKDWDMATEEQKARLQVLQTKLGNGGAEEERVLIINDTKRDPDQ